MTAAKLATQPKQPAKAESLARAFSLTDDLTLTGRAKGVMMIHASVLLLTIAIVAARAVNILK